MQKTKEQLAVQFKALMTTEQKTQNDIAGLLSCSQQAMSERIKKFSWRYIDLVNLLDKLGYDVVWVKRENTENGIEQK